MRKKRRREDRLIPAAGSEPIAICVCCQNPFGASEGVVTDESAICDICNGD